MTDCGSPVSSVDRGAAVVVAVLEVEPLVGGVDESDEGGGAVTGGVGALAAESDP
jgi:hypothetical protein